MNDRIKGRIAKVALWTLVGLIVIASPAGWILIIGVVALASVYPFIRLIEWLAEKAGYDTNW